MIEMTWYDLSDSLKHYTWSIQGVDMYAESHSTCNNLAQRESMIL